ncbi:class E sortase [Streptacidiphilus pinicola]|uniref:Class E sortase n=1 Tax=Streptacidiphilus pinicola TaxID=2219663 RepID=A0A2X0JEV2_9ACTN|nr:class E sortase [Streptacidiphilus pinicola]RAG86108.1 class E sortase [Streptacidiphilus pinicola]
MRPRLLWGLRRGLILFGELAVTLGLVTILLATYELWWTNRAAEANATNTVAALEQQWDRQAQQQAQQPMPTPGTPSADPTPDSSPSGSPIATPGHANNGGSDGSWAVGPGSDGSGGGTGIDSMARDLTAFAVVRIPVLGLVFPVAEGVDKYAVLNHGYIGHYPGTAMPGQQGNFAIAGHRNTHGEPFRHLDRIGVGDVVIVEVSGWDYVYRVDSVLPQTEPSDGTVILPEPYSSDHPSGRYGYRTPGKYITLTTCTPAFTSLYRMVVWGHLVGQQPRPVTVGA